jgi:hypothetical protein
MVELLLAKIDVNQAEIEKKYESEGGRETYGALKERYENRHLAVGRRQLKKLTQGDGGSWKKLAVASKGMTRRVIPVPRKGHGGQGPGRDIVARGTPKGRTLERRQRTHQEDNNGVRGPDLK